MSSSLDRVRIALATEQERQEIYRLRHTVYAEELHQHPVNAAGRLTDALDAYNTYIVAAVGDRLAGFVSLTPPGRAYSVDKYVSRSEWPFPADETVYEVRLLTVRQDYRQSQRGAEVAGLLIYAALRWVQWQGGRRLIGTGRREVLGLYRKIGLRPLGRPIQSGEAHFELMAGVLDEVGPFLSRYRPLIEYVAPWVDWRLDVPYLLSDV